MSVEPEDGAADVSALPNERPGMVMLPSSNGSVSIGRELEEDLTSGASVGCADDDGDSVGTLRVTPGIGGTRSVLSKMPRLDELELDVVSTAEGILTGVMTGLAVKLFRSESMILRELSAVGVAVAVMAASESA